MSVGGVVLPPAGCLPRAYDAVRRTGGLCIADEVQVCPRSSLPVTSSESWHKGFAGGGCH